MHVALRFFQVNLTDTDASSARVAHTVLTKRHQCIGRIDARRTEAVPLRVVGENMLLFGDVVNFKTGVLRTCVIDP
jgi:hypothetical protein